MFDDFDFSLRRWNPLPAWQPPTHPQADSPGANRLRGYFLAAPTRPVTDSEPTPDSLERLKAEKPGPDGIRTGLVARIRQLIAEGAYDTPERWKRAEERLLDRINER
jgi:hypothetical protein